MASKLQHECRNPLHKLWSLFVVTLMSAGCALAYTKPGSDVDGQKILMYKGNDYEVRIKSFKVQPEQASDNVTDYLKSHRNNPGGTNSTPACVIGRYYLFNIQRLVGDMPLRGYWVNGDTGEVEFREDNRRIHWNMIIPGGSIR